MRYFLDGWLGSQVISMLDSGEDQPGYKMVVTLSVNSLRQTDHTHCASVHQATKLVAVFLRVVGVTAGLAKSNGSLPPGLWLTSPTVWLTKTRISSGTLGNRVWVIYMFLRFIYFYNIWQRSSWWNGMESSTQYSSWYKKLCYRRGTATCVMSIEILPIATQQCRNYLYDKSWRNESYEVGQLHWAMHIKHVHSTVTRSSHFHCLIGVMNKTTTDVLWISAVYRGLAVPKFSKSTM